MTIGYPVDQASVNNKAGQLVAQLWTTLRDLSELNDWMIDETHDLAFMEALGFDSDEVTALKAAIADLGSASGLYGVAHGQSHPSGDNDFFFNAKKLTGTTWAG